uniref:ATP-dependent DNA helicase n=1 Tax=Octopus bimaculoides TaxID=37653 RepID=A0A0L8FFD6_OCTBM
MGGEPIQNLGFPLTNRGDLNTLSTEIMREISYNKDELTMYINDNLPQLLPDQCHAYSTVIKTKVRQENKIALDTATSGIAATLLLGGWTHHSTFKLPLDLCYKQDPVCNISKNFAMGKLIQRCHFIVWDECTMAHKKAFQVVDRTLRGIRNCNSMMRNVTVLLGIKVDEINASIKSSVLWHHVKTLQLSTNMRSRLSRHQSAELFAEQLLKLSEGRLPIDEEQFLELNPICNSTHSIDDLMGEIFPNLLRNYNNTDWICKRAILAPENVAVHSINNMLLNKLPGEVFTYNSIDNVVDDQDSVNYSIEFFNSLQPPGCL